MRHQVPTGVFERKPTVTEKKSDATARAAQQIIDAEKFARDAKTERLRLARLEREKNRPAAKPVTKRTAKI